MTIRTYIQCDHRLCGEEFHHHGQHPITAVQAGWGVARRLTEVGRAYHGTPHVIVDLCPYHYKETPSD